MSKSAHSGRAKRSHSAGNPPTAQHPATPAQTTTPSVSADRRHAMIAESAYHRAAARGFSGGDCVADWLASEHEVDALLSGGGR